MTRGQSPSRSCEASGQEAKASISPEGPTKMPLTATPGGESRAAHPVGSAWCDNSGSSAWC